MTDLVVKVEKVNQFLTQFDSGKLFLAWCRVHQVKGIRYKSESCLVARAIQMATGLTDVKVSDAGDGEEWYCDIGEDLVTETVDLPSVLQEIPGAFDAGKYPDLIEPLEPLSTD